MSLTTKKIVLDCDAVLRYAIEYWELSLQKKRRREAIKKKEKVIKKKIVLDSDAM